MSFYESLLAQTQAERDYLLGAPIIQQAMTGQVALHSYIAFLTEAYHHVKHTVPLLMACGAPAGASGVAARGHRRVHRGGVRPPGVGTQRHRRLWRRSGSGAQRHPAPAHRTDGGLCLRPHRPTQPGEFLRHGQRPRRHQHRPGHPGGRHHQDKLQLPNKAFSYLNSHGSLDLEHIEFFKKLMNRLDNDDDKAAVVHTAKVVYRLYGDMFRSLPLSTEE